MDNLNTQYAIFTFAALITIITISLITIIQIPKIKRIDLKISLATLCLSYSIWLIANIIFYYSSNYTYLYLSNSIANVSVIIFISCFYLIIRLIGEPLSFHQLIHKERTLKLILITSASLILLSVLPNAVDKEILIENSQKIIKPNVSKYMLYIFAIGLTLITIYRIFQKANNAQNQIIKFQAKLLLFSTYVSLVIATTLMIVIPISLNTYQYAILAPFVTLIVITSLALILSDYKYYDLKLIEAFIVKSLILSLLITFPHIILEIYPIQNTIEIIIFLVWTLSILIIYKSSNLENLINRLLGIYKQEEALNKAIKIINQATTTKELVNWYSNYLKKTLKATFIKVLLKTDQEFNQYKSFFLQLFNESTTKQLIICEEEIKLYYGLEINKLRFKVLQQLGKELTVYAIFKLEIADEISGVLLLGPKHNNNIYWIQDINLINQSIKSFTVRLKELEILEKTNEFNKKLKEQVKITTQKLRLQNKLIKAKLQQEKDMIGIMGHELRTPMTIAKTSAELLLRAIQNNNLPRKEYLEDKLRKIYDSIEKEANLIQTLLSTSHIDNSKINLNPEKTNIDELVQQEIEAHITEANKKGLYIKLENQLKEKFIYNDPLRIHEVVSNLISNAIKYTQQGGITIILTEDNEHIYITVKDTGIGIPEEEIKNIGKRFYRIHQHLDKEKNIVRAGGTGLGLYVVKGILKAMGGNMFVESKIGQGSTFTAQIPKTINTNLTTDNISETLIVRKETQVNKKF